MCVITGCNEVVAKVMVLHVCVILFTGGVSGQNPPRQGEPPRTRQTPPGTRQTPLGPGRHPPDQADPLPRQGEPPGPGRTPQTRETPPPDQADPLGPDPPDQADPPGTGRHPPGRRLQHTVNERPVRILLECILVGSAVCNTLAGPNYTFSTVDIRKLLTTICYELRRFIARRARPMYFTKSFQKCLDLSPKNPSNLNLDL